MIGSLQTRVCKQPIIAFYFEFETKLKFYNLEAWDFGTIPICKKPWFRQTWQACLHIHAVSPDYTGTFASSTQSKEVDKY